MQVKLSMPALMSIFLAVGCAAPVTNINSSIIGATGNTSTGTNGNGGTSNGDDAPISTAGNLPTGSATSGSGSSNGLNPTTGFSPGFILQPIGGDQSQGSCADILANGGLKDVTIINQSSSKTQQLSTWINSSSFGQFLQKQYADSHSSNSNGNSSSSSGGFDLGVEGYSIGAESADSNTNYNVTKSDGSQSSMTMSQFQNLYNNQLSQSQTEDSANKVYQSITDTAVVDAWKACVLKPATGMIGGIVSDAQVIGNQIILKLTYAPTGDSSVDPNPTIQSVKLINASESGSV